MEILVKFGFLFFNHHYINPHSWIDYSNNLAFIIRVFNYSIIHVFWYSQPFDRGSTSSP